MTKHSKNNTASSVFSYAEYKKLDYGTKRQRLGNESMRRFDACSLCLNKARDPHACSEGHLFCKECILSDLLSQKKDLKRQKAELERLKKEAEEEQKAARAAARERVLDDFKKGQGLAASNSTTAVGDQTPSAESRGMKRKFEFDSSVMESLVSSAEEAALKVIKQEQAEALRAKLPDFWLPSLTPTYTSKGAPKSLQEIKLQTTCRGGNPPHPIALKDLTQVKFSVHTTGGSNVSQDSEPLCEPCKKTLSNNTLLFLMRPCSHVVCKTCTETLCRLAKQCVVCDKELKDKDIIGLNREGTGFAGGGLAETSRAGIAFQG